MLQSSRKGHLLCLETGQVSMEVLYRTTLNEKMNISRSVTGKMTPLFRLCYLMQACNQGIIASQDQSSDHSFTGNVCRITPSLMLCLICVNNCWVIRVFSVSLVFVLSLHLLLCWIRVHSIRAFFISPLLNQLQSTKIRANQQVRTESVRITGTRHETSNPVI